METWEGGRKAGADLMRNCRRRMGGYWLGGVVDGCRAEGGVGGGGHGIGKRWCKVPVYAAAVAGERKRAGGW